MYLMYVDESGDIGLRNSPTKYFVLSGIVLHELRWRDTLGNLVEFRRNLRDNKGLKLREEIHCRDFINSPGELIRIKRNDRLDILKKCIDWLNTQADLSIITVVVDKTKANKSSDIFELAWNTLLMRFENTIRHRNFPGPSNSDDRGMVLPDNTDGEKLTKLLRKMRHYNYISNRRDLYGSGSRNVKLNYIIEDPFLKDSKNSFLHQMADVVAYFARQQCESNSYLRKKGATTFYKRLSNVHCKVASPKHPYGIVEL